MFPNAPNYLSKGVKYVRHFRRDPRGSGGTPPERLIQSPRGGRPTLNKSPRAHALVWRRHERGGGLGEAGGPAFGCGVFPSLYFVLKCALRCGVGVVSGEWRGGGSSQRVRVFDQTRRRVGIKRPHSLASFFLSPVKNWCRNLRPHFFVCFLLELAVSYQNLGKISNFHAADNCPSNFAR